ncbi:DBH-like monooxygenase protein 1 homolog [Cherax quadricarinatus]|uniref:DBH-like monooxygenase protein 1 homolog n=1 Tax=Cherax quadricarinatus TaxID=27406 RepID=UPI00387E764F
MLLPELVLLTAVSCCGWVAAAAWQQESPMDDKGNVVLFWTVDVKKNVLMVEIQGRTLGYVALGISPNGTMEGADLLIGYVDYEGEPHVLDYFVDLRDPDDCIVDLRDPKDCKVDLRDPEGCLVALRDPQDCLVALRAPEDCLVALRDPEDC